MHLRKNLSPLLFIGFFLLLWLTVFGIWSAHAADSSVAPRSVNPYGLTLNVKYGNLVPINPQIYGSFSVNADGSMDFDCRLRENLQVIYLFNIQSYGNGTLTLRFQLDRIPTLVKAPGAASTSLSSTMVETITYTVNQSTTLELDFIGLASTRLGNAAVIASIFFPIFFVGFGSIFSFIFFGNMMYVLRGQKPKLSMMRAFGYSAAVIIGWSMLVIITAISSGTLKGLGN